MHEKEINALTDRIIGCAIEVHRQLGPGLLEATYEAALCIEFDAAGLRFHRQPSFPVIYKGKEVGLYRPDLIVEDAVVVEIKSVERLDPVFRGAGDSLFEGNRQEDRFAHKLQFATADQGR